jgi:predicted RNase H-like nuclease (RuvC/YqgF family)
MPKEKVHVGARIPKDLAMKCEQRYGNMTNAINIALELLFNQSENIVDKNENIVDKIENDNIELKAKTEEKEKTIKELQINNENLIKEIDNLKFREPDNKEIQQLQEIRIAELQANNQERISDLKAQVQILQDQLKTKDEQIDKKDSQIKNLTTITESQVNSRSVKMIEAPGAKRPWWRFW